MSYGYGLGFGLGYGYGGNLYNYSSNQIAAIRGQQAVNQTSSSVSIYNSQKDADIKENILNFADELERGHEDKAMQYYDELQGILGKYSEYSSADRAYIANLIESTISNDRGQNIRLEDLIKDNAVSSEQRDWQEFRFGNASRIDNNTKETMLNRILGKKESTEYNEVGQTIAKVGLMGVIPAAVGGIPSAMLLGSKIGGLVGSSVPIVGTLLGAAVGAAAGIGLAFLVRGACRLFAPKEV